MDPTAARTDDRPDLLEPGSARGSSGDRVRLALPAGAEALARARRFVRLYAQQSGVDEERADDLVQAAAELLGAEGAVDQLQAVEVRELPDGITVVLDLAGLEEVRVRDEAAALLSALTRDWGWYRTPGALQVWCEVAAG
ncbi:ATP-binding protein [Kineococcus sp. G2]|uniref:ATP-binding protein n=1 Tax=Kineococcus sp. G2 TaxID=3127484 RepID=UPI00301E0A7E